MSGESHLDLVSQPEPEPKRSNPRTTDRPFVGVLFRCCGCYGRAYLDQLHGYFQAHCPRCAAPIRVHLSDQGSSSRFFEIG
jgi:uncharacterized paraquat-inducible protein A